MAIALLFCKLRFTYNNVMNHMRGGSVKAFPLLGVTYLKGTKAHESIGVLPSLIARQNIRISKGCKTVKTTVYYTFGYNRF
jgi:hypothetical protein